ncbi:hypothetical protein KEM55_003201 [Ascosphaera atra]|nr:hypothetical protein KEM55_003201 [Ascosphaera atra]
MVCTIFWILFLVDHVGRRNLLLFGAAGCTVCLWIIGGYIKIAQPEQHPKQHVDSGGIAAVFFFYLWTCFYSMSWNGIPWIYNSEMFEPSVRAIAQACAAASNWLWNFLISRFTPQMFTAMGYGVYFFFASLTVLAGIFVFFLVPETKGIPLEKIDQLFEKRPAWRAHREVLVEMGREVEDWSESERSVVGEQEVMKEVGRIV